MEFLPILQDFVPCRGRCPKNQEYYKNKKIKEQEKNDIEQINHMMKQCKKEFSEFRKYCCSVCHRMFRKKGVTKLSEETKKTYFKCNNELAKKCFSFKPRIFSNIGESICHTCSNNMKAGKLPRFAIANGLELKPVPEEISQLCDLERQLIAQIISFSKIVGLRGG